jgi:hypothetical protein
MLTKTEIDKRRRQAEGEFDPKPAKGGGCAVCGSPRPPTAVNHGDPFCSATCARIYYEVKGA